MRHRITKHWEPKWKQLRRAKVVKIKLPNLQEKEEDLTEEQIRSKMKEHGLLPPRPWVETQFYISTTGGVFEPYVPPEGDGKISPITAQVCAFYFGMLLVFYFLISGSQTKIGVFGKEIKNNDGYQEDQAV